MLPLKYYMQYKDTTFLLVFVLKPFPGLPKPAIVTHFKTIGAGNSFNAFDMSADDIVYNALPLYHSSGLMVGFGNVVTKGKPHLLCCCRCFYFVILYNNLNIFERKSVGFFSF